MKQIIECKKIMEVKFEYSRVRMDWTGLFACRRAESILYTSKYGTLGEFTFVPRVCHTDFKKAVWKNAAINFRQYVG